MSLEAAIQVMHKHPTAVAFTYILPDADSKLGGTVFLKGKKPVSLTARDQVLPPLSSLARVCSLWMLALVLQAGPRVEKYVAHLG